MDELPPAVTHQGKYLLYSRRRSSVFPKVVFSKRYDSRDDEDDGNEYLHTFTPMKNRRLSVENNRRVVKHLRMRLGSIKERITNFKDIPEKEDRSEKDDSLVATEKQHRIKMPILAPNYYKREITFTESKLNKFINQRETPKLEQSSKDPIFDSVPSLPAIIIEDEEKSESDEDNDDDDKRPTTAGIFVDWESDPEISEDDQAQKNFAVEIHDETYAYLWNVNARFMEPRRKVIIYVSSDPSMMRERKALLADIFPKLSSTARSLFLQLEIVDLLLDGSPDRKHLAKYHIENAATNSAATTFVGLLSNEKQYQHTVLPRYIPAEIMLKFLHLPLLETVACEAMIRTKYFHMQCVKRGNADPLKPMKKVRFADDLTDEEIQQAIELRCLNRKMSFSKKAIYTLQRYYRQDTNAVPSVFILNEESRTKDHDKILVQLLLKYVKRIHNDPIVKIWENQNLLAVSTEFFN